MEKRKTTIWIILLSIFAVILLVLVAVVGIRFYKQMQARVANEQLQEQVNTGQQQFAESEENTEIPQKDILEELGIEIPQKNLDFESLKQENGDIYAWIYIPGTKVDYPVFQHPEDDTYYLEHNMDGSEGLPGCIYSELVNSQDFTDPHTVLYGHNMKDGTMFGSLHDFEDSQVFEEYQYMYVYTPEKTFVYRIFAAYEYNASHLIYNFDLGNRDIFQGYLNEIFEIRDMNANIRKDMEVNADNHILTLSTCVTGKKEKRYLVQGVLLNDEE